MRLASALALALSLGCGGRAELAPPEDLAPAATPRGEPTSLEPVLAELGVTSAFALTETELVVTTTATRVGDALVETGGVYVAAKISPRPALVDLDRSGAAYDALTVQDGTAFVATRDGRLRSVPLAGGRAADVGHAGAPITALVGLEGRVYAGTARGDVLVLDGADLRLVANLGAPITGLAASSEGVVAALGAEAGEGAIVRLSGQSAAILAREPAAPCAIARDRERVYWTSRQGRLFGLTTAEADAPAVVARDARASCALALDGDRVLFLAARPPGDGSTEAVATTLMSAPRLGGTPEPLAPTTSSARAVAADGFSVYVLTTSGVARLAKP